MELTILDQIQAKEQARLSAMLSKDFDTLSNLLDEELIYVHSTGRIMTKAEYIAHLRQDSFAYETIEAVNSGYCAANESFVLVQNVSARMKIKGEFIDTKLSVMTVWRIRYEEWKL